MFLFINHHRNWCCWSKYVSLIFSRPAGNLINISFFFFSRLNQHIGSYIRWWWRKPRNRVMPNDDKGRLLYPQPQVSFWSVVMTRGIRKNSALCRKWGQSILIKLRCRLKMCKCNQHSMFNQNYTEFFV